MPYKVTAFGMSHVGLVRQNNEDSWAEIPDLGFYVLADGMGGHQAGEIASNLAVNAICDILNRSLSRDAKQRAISDVKEEVHLAVQTVNGVVYKMGQSEEGMKGMGTTLCCMQFHEKGIVFAHVGDSRIYRFRNSHLEQITKDHSLLRELVDLGQLSERNASEFLYKNIITRAIGTEPYVEPSVQTATIHDQDIYLMCTDGLSDMLSRKEIEAVLARFTDLEDCVNQLVKEAIAKGGNDNITVVMMKVHTAHEEKNLPRS